MRTVQLSSRLMGAMCGTIWMPAVEATVEVDSAVRGAFGFWPEGQGYTFREALLGYLTRHGGDFQNPNFTADTIIRLERRVWRGDGSRSRTVTREIYIHDLPDCDDLVNADIYTNDFSLEAA